MKRTSSRSEWKRGGHAFLHPYASGEMGPGSRRGVATSVPETGGGLLHPLDMHSRCTQGFRVHNDLRVTQ